MSPVVLLVKSGGESGNGGGVEPGELLKTVGPCLPSNYVSAGRLGGLGDAGGELPSGSVGNGGVDALLPCQPIFEIAGGVTDSPIPRRTVGNLGAGRIDGPGERLSLFGVL